MNTFVCPCCGQPLPDGPACCPSCGWTPPPPAEEAAPGAPETEGGALVPPPAPGPRYAPQSPQEPDGGLSTAQYFWTLFLFAIPVLGLVLMLYWSFGTTTCPARQRLARASLIKTGVWGVIVTLFLVCAFAVTAVFGRSLLFAVEDYLYGGYGYYDDYGYGDDYGSYYDGYEDYYGYYHGGAPAQNRPTI